MKLNPDYVRDILLYIEKNLNYENSQSNTPHKHKEMLDVQILKDECFTTYDKSELSYAMELLVKEGYIDLAASPHITNGNLYSARIIGLTWKGHELLNNVRNTTIWNAVKEKSKNFGISSVQVLFNCAGQVAMALMSDPNAIQNFLTGIHNII